MESIQSAVAKGQRALNEYQAKELLRSYGIPTVAETLARTPDEAVAAAAAIGWPVALKACGPDILHKTEAGLLALGLAGEAMLRDQWIRIEKAARQLHLDGMLVQAMAKGRREMVIGMKRESAFGPCVMVGLGGVMTEVFRDTAFRVAPFDNVEATDMIGELRSRSLLEAFRGEAAADLDTLCRTAVAVGRIAEDFSAIAEIDINPVVISPDGKIVAVDALILLESEEEK